MRLNGHLDGLDGIVVRTVSGLWERLRRNGAAAPDDAGSRESFD
jgi:hypothetical protein